MIIGSCKTSCVSSNAEFVNKQVDTAREVSKKGKYANMLIALGDWSEFDVKTDYATRLLKNDKYLIFVHSSIEYFYPLIK